MNAPANLLAISPALRAAHPDWKRVQQARIDAGYARAVASAALEIPPATQITGARI